MDHVRKLVAIVLMIEIVILARLSLLSFPLSPHRYIQRILIKTIPIEMPFQVKTKNTFPTVKSWTKIKGDGKGWGKTILSVRAALEEAAAFFWDFDSQASIDISGDVERLTLEEEKGEFEKVVRRRQNIMMGSTTGQDEHEFVYKMSLHVVGDNQIVIILISY